MMILITTTEIADEVYTCVLVAGVALTFLYVALMARKETNY